jgi:hypothetical protein
VEVAGHVHGVDGNARRDVEGHVVDGVHRAVALP